MLAAVSSFPFLYNQKMNPNKYLWACLFLLCSYQIQACDVCGCSVNANYFGILPQFRRSFIGLRYMNNSLQSRPLPSLFEGGTSGYTQSLQRTELWGRYYLTPRVQVFAFVPYQYNIKREAETTTQAHGLSDISLITNYVLINTGDSGRFKWRNTMLVGAGIKLPTGRFDPSGAAALQTGTGSCDWMLNAIHTIRHKKIGINTDVNMRVNSTAHDYRYGNRVTSSMRFFYWKKHKMMSFLPHAGMLVEWAQKDRKYGIEQKYTGGYGYYAAVGMDIYLRKATAGFIYTIPFSESLNGGYANTNQRLSLQLLYLL